jgi:hypothetical protein
MTLRVIISRLIATLAPRRRDERLSDEIRRISMR